MEGGDFIQNPEGLTFTAVSVDYSKPKLSLLSFFIFYIALPLSFLLFILNFSIWEFLFNTYLIPISNIHILIYTGVKSPLETKHTAGKGG